MTNTVQSTRSRRGQANYLAGLAAEEEIQNRYERTGHEVAETRWRGAGGEIDLVMRKGEEIVFVEVKRAGCLHDAAFRLGQRQLRRLFQAGSEYLSGEPKGLLTPARFDLALVGGAGDVEILENITPT